MPNQPESRGAMTAQQFQTIAMKHFPECRTTDAGLTAGNTATVRSWNVGDDLNEANRAACLEALREADALSAHKIAQLTQERDDARQRLADYESADLQIAELHAKELADHEKEVAELRAALEVAQKENEGLSRDYQYLMKERDDAKEELEHVLDDWNALVKASGSRTNGAAIGHITAMRAELSRLRSQGAGRWMQDAAFEIARHVEVYGRFKDAQMVEIIRKHAPVEGAGQSSNPADWGKCTKCHQEMSKGVLLHVCAGLASPPESTMEALGRLLKESGATVKFGLEAQGHIPTVEKLRSQGKSWDEIGKEIGWHGPTVEKFYGYHLEREGKKVSPPEGQV